MPYSDAEKRKQYNKEYRKKHYADNKDYYKQKAYEWTKARRKEISAKIAKMKSVECADCKKSFPPYVMHFDHLRDKNFNIGMAQSKTVTDKKLYAEVEKCEIVCANCHAIRTHKRKVTQ